MSTALKTAVKGLVENYYIIQETRKALELREKALCRDELILYTKDREGKDKKVIGRIVDEDDDQVVVQKKTTEGKITLKEVDRVDIRKIIHRKFDTEEEAQREIFRFPIGNREADVSSVPLMRMEGDIKRHIQSLVKEWPVWSQWLKNVSGVGPIIAGGLLAYVDINICHKVSQLWHYAGQHVVDGEIPRLKKGVKRSWNRRLQTIIWNFGESIVKSGKGYRALFDERKHHEIQNRFLTVNLNNGRSQDDLAGFIAGHLLDEPVGKKKKGHYISNKASALSIIKAMNGSGELMLERKPGHINNRAKRHVRKVFLAHVYKFWREAEGLPVRTVYAMTLGPEHEEIPIIME
jgi:hypothetical protein